MLSRRCRRRCGRWGTTWPCCCRGTTPIKIHSVLISSVTLTLGDHVRFPAIAEAAPVEGVRYFFVDDPPFFDRPELYGDSRGRLSGQRRALCGIFARGDRVHEARVAAGCGPLPRLADRAGAACCCARNTPRIARCARCPLCSRFTTSPIREFSTPLCCRRSVCRIALFSVDALEFFGKVNFLKGGLIYRGLSDDGEPALRQGNSDGGVRLRARRRDSQQRETGWSAS